MLFRDHPKNDVYAAIELALAATISNSDGIKHILLANQEMPDKIESLSDWPTLADADTSIYGQLGGQIFTRAPGFLGIHSTRLKI